MADYHILSVNKYGTAAQVVMHFAVPDAVNDVGVNYRAALVAMQDDMTSAVLNLDAAEQAQLNAGEVFERSLTFHTHSGETLAQKRTRLDAKWILVKADTLAELAIWLRFYGYERDLP